MKRHPFSGRILLDNLAHSQRREGGWWAGVLAVMLGMAGTGITADTPVGTPLVTRLVCLGVASLITSLVTALALDGAKWLSIKVRGWLLREFVRVVMLCLFF